MKNFSLFCLLVSLSYLFFGCSLSDLIGPIDEPPASSKLKGPKQADLETQTFALTKIVDFPFKGEVHRYGSRYLLRGHYEHVGRHAIIESGTITEIAPKPLYELFLDESGGVWGLTRNGTQETISQYKNGSWQEYAVLSDDGYFHTVVKAEPTEFSFATSKGIVIWDVQQKTVKQIIPAGRSGVTTRNYLIGSEGEQITLYDNQTQKSIVSWKFNDYVVTKKGITNHVWGAFEDSQRNVWMVVKDGNWDGVLLKYDGNSLQKLSLIPVGNYDSGRSISSFNLDKKGDFWLNVDGVNYIYTKAGKWIRPQFDSINNNYQARVSSDDQGNLTITGEAALYLIDL